MTDESIQYEQNQTQQATVENATPTIPPSFRTACPFRVRCALDGMYFENFHARNAQAYAEQTGGRVYSWKTSGDGNSDWLEAGVGCSEVIGLLVLPSSLPERMDIQHDVFGEGSELDEGEPFYQVLIESLLLDINGWLDRMGFSYRLPSRFHLGPEFTRFIKHPVRTRPERTDRTLWLFRPGRVVITPGATDALARAGVGPGSLLQRHLSGDWGNVCEADRAENELSLREDSRLMSVYPLPVSGETLWIITEGDRSITTLLLSSEY